jgi:hypothetical protein
MRGLILMLGLAGMPAQASQQNLQDCLKLARQQVSHTVNLQNDCPEVFNELKSQGVLDSLVPSLPVEINLPRLTFLVDHQYVLRQPGLIHQDGLDKLIANILISDTNNELALWWESFLKWLDNLKPEEYEEQYQWLTRFLEAIRPKPDALLNFLYGVIFLLVCLSGWLIFSELRKSGYFLKPRGKTQPVDSVFTPHMLSTSAGLGNIQDLSPKLQIAAWLEQVVEALCSHHIIPDDQSLTHRQILHYLAQHNPTGITAFSDLLYTAEPILYGNKAVDGLILDTYRRNVQAVLAGNMS